MPTAHQIAQAIDPDAFADWQQKARERGLPEDNPRGYAAVVAHYEKRQGKALEAGARVLALLERAQHP